MKKQRIGAVAVLVAVVVGMVFVFASCERGADMVTDSESVSVSVTFSPYEVESMTCVGGDCHAGEPLVAVTRAAVADYASRLDAWVYCDGKEVQAVHQTSGDADFATLSLTLDRRKTYTLYAVAHKGADVATLADGVVSFPDDKVTHSFFYSETFCPGEKTSLSCLMSRIVGQFRLEITDAIPSEVVSFRFSVPQSATRYAVAGYGTNMVDRVSTIAWNGASRVFSIFIMGGDDEAKLCKVGVDALDEGGGVLQSRTFSDVPIRNGYRTNYRGSFFVDGAVSAGFSVDDMIDNETVDF